MPSYVEKYEYDTKEDRFIEMLPISFILKLMVKVAIKNHSRDQRHNEFPVEIQHFATYIHMMSGKACYEVLCENLLSQANTICD